MITQLGNVTIVVKDLARSRWGGILANFEDPDGNKFFLLQMPADFRK